MTLAEATIRRLWPQRNEGSYVRGILRQSIRDAQTWKRMGAPKGLLAARTAAPAVVPVKAVREPDPPAAAADDQPALF